MKAKRFVFQAPHPFRGKRNESSYLLKTAAKVAEIYNLTQEEVGRATCGRTFGDVQMAEVVVNHNFRVGFQDRHSAVCVKTGLSPRNGVDPPTPAVIRRISGCGLGYGQLSIGVVAVGDDEQLI